MFSLFYHETVILAIYYASRLYSGIDRLVSRCYIIPIKCLPKQTGKELKSMIVREVVAS